MNRTKEYKDKYHHALDKMYDLFKYGRIIETDLDKKVNIAMDEFARILVICDYDMSAGNKDYYFAEIKGVCNRAIESIKERE